MARLSKDTRRLVLATSSLTLSGAALYGLYRHERTKAAAHMEEKARSRNEESAGKALVGGPFSLVDLDGIPRTDLDYRGKYLLLYFGYALLD